MSKSSKSTKAEPPAPKATKNREHFAGRSPADPVTVADLVALGQLTPGDLKAKEEK